MLTRAFAVGLVCAGALCAQRKTLGRQDYCFNNPSSIVCPGHEYAKPMKPDKPAPGPRSITNVISPNQKGGTPALITIGGIDWRFADPYADVLVGFNFGTLVSSPLARSLFAKVGATRGASEADINKLLDGLSDLDQVAISVHNNHIVAMITGRVTESGFPAPEGLKVVPVSASTMLVGHTDAVDGALQRMAAGGPLMEVSKLAEQRQAASEFWAIGSAASLGPGAASAGVKRFSMTVYLRDRLTTDLAVEFQGLPDPNTLKNLEKSMGPSTLEGNALHARTSLEFSEAEQKFGTILASPVGQKLGDLVEAARYLPARETKPINASKPVIYGLDDGPRVVNQ
jgi:hypothetical protein